MSYKSKIYSMGLASAIVALLLNGICYSIVRDLCMDNEGIFIFSSLFFAATFLISIAFLFSSPGVFAYWKNKALIFFVVSVVLVYVLPDLLSGSIISVDGELVAKWLAGIFFIVSIIIILIKKQKHSILDLDEC